MQLVPLGIYKAMINGLGQTWEFALGGELDKARSGRVPSFRATPSTVFATARLALAEGDRLDNASINRWSAHGGIPPAPPLSSLEHRLAKHG